MYSFLNLRNIHKLKILHNTIVQTNYRSYNQFFSKSSRTILKRPSTTNYAKNGNFKIKNTNILIGRFKTDLPSNNGPRVKLTWAEMKRLLSLAKNEKWTIIGAIGCLAISSGITMAVPYAFGKIMDSIYLDAKELHHAKTKFKQFCLFLCGVFVIGGLANFGRVYLFHNASLRIVKDLRSKLFNRMLRQEAAWHDTKGTGELVNRLSNDTYFVGDSLSQNLSNGLRSLVMASVGASMMFYTSPELAFVGLGIVPCIAGLAIVYGRYVKKITRQMMDRYAEVMKTGEERLANVKSVKMFTKEAYENERFGEKLNSALGIAYKDSLAKATFFGLTGFSGNVVIITVLFYGGNLVADNHLTVGALTSFIIYAGYTALSLGGISNFYTEMYRGAGSATRIFEIFDRQYAIPIDGGLIPKTAPKGQITFDNVVFSYPSREKLQILNKFNFSAHPGTITAIVGRSGSGKTTIAQLLLRLYDPQEGGIYLDGTNLKDLNPHYLRSYIGAVPQEPILFSGTIRENIMYGLNIGDSITEAAFDEICNQAHVTEFISTFPNGMETMVGQRGILLSGGQKQRVAIARAILKNPTILILDEATSALDAMSESLVQDALENLTKNRTVLTIAHRLSTIRNADKIVVIGDGIVKEEGSYYELIQTEGGYFRDLVKLQTFVKSH